MSLMASLFSGKGQVNDSVKILSAADYKEAIKNNSVQLVDVRTGAEFNQGAIKGAVNIDYFKEDSFEKKFNQLDKGKPIFIYCRSGNRSQKAAARLDSLGFKEIYDLKGGYLNWSQKK